MGCRVSLIGAGIVNTVIGAVNNGYPSKNVCLYLAVFSWC